MVFHSPNFLIFMLILLIPYYLWKRGRIPLLVVANAIFYGVSGIGLLVLFALMAFLTFAVVHLMRRRGLRWTFWIGIAANAGNLIFFKYTLMLLDTFELV